MIELLLFFEKAWYTAVVYIAVCSLKHSQLQQGATLFLFNVFLMTILWLVYKGYYEHVFPFLSQNNSGNIFYSFYTKWYVSQYCIFPIVYLFIIWRWTWICEKHNYTIYYLNRVFIFFVSSVKTFLLSIQLSVGLILMHISSVKPVPWLEANLHHLLSDERQLVHRAVVHNRMWFMRLIAQP